MCRMGGKMRYLLDVRHAGCRALLHHWEELCAGDGVPSHAQIHPRALKKILPIVFMLDVSNPTEPVYSLAGTRLCEQFGGELRGEPFFATWEASSVSVANALMQTSQEQRVPISFEILTTFGGLQLVDVEIVLAPLTCGDAGIERFIGAMHIANPQPLLYSGTVISQRLVATQIAQHPSVRSSAGVVQTVRSYPSAGGSMSLRACNDVFPESHPSSPASMQANI